MVGNKATAMLIVGALASGGGAAYFTNDHIQNEIQEHVERIDAQYKPVPVVVPNRNLRAGDLLNSQNLSIREVPASFVHAEAINANQSSSAIGHRLVHPVNDGEPLLMFHISETQGSGFSSIIKKGKRAITFSVDNVSSINGLLRPGDRIDLLMTIDDDGKEITQALLTDVQIIATGQSVDKLRMERGTFQSITLLVDPLDAAKITHAKSVADLTVMLRSPGDQSDYGDQVVTKDTLLGKKVSKPKVYKKRNVEIIRGGVS